MHEILGESRDTLKEGYTAEDYVPYRTICQMLQFLANFIFVGQYGHLKGG